MIVAKIMYLFHSVACTPGMFHNKVSQRCEACPKDTFSNVASISCTKCSKGYGTLHKQASNCTGKQNFTIDVQLIALKSAFDITHDIFTINNYHMFLQFWYDFFSILQGIPKCYPARFQIYAMNQLSTLTICVAKKYLLTTEMRHFHLKVCNQLEPAIKYVMY